MNPETETTESAQLLRYAQPAELCDWAHANRTLRYVAPARVVPADLLVPSFWAQLGRAGLLSQNDIVRCIPADSSWFVELLVRDAGPEGAVMLVLRAGQLEGSAAPPGSTKDVADEGADFYYAGPLLKWQVLGKDGRVWKSNLETRADAAIWLKAHREMQRRTTKGRS